MSSYPFSNGRAFDPDTLEVMGLAFDTAWSQLLASGSVLTAKFRAEHTREALALRIVAATRQGERDAVVLRDDALAYAQQLVFEPRRHAQPTSG